MHRRITTLNEYPCGKTRDTEFASRHLDIDVAVILVIIVGQFTAPIIANLCGLGTFSLTI